MNATAVANPREIFHYNDGTKARAVDPLVIIRRMQQQPIDFAAELALTQSVDDPKVKEEAWETLVNAVRTVFEVEPFAEKDGLMTGLTENETMDLLDQFGLFVAAVKKNSSESPTSPQSSEPAPCPSLETPASNTSDTLALS
jgi:hypothetical protein